MTLSDRELAQLRNQSEREAHKKPHPPYGPDNGKRTAAWKREGFDYFNDSKDKERKSTKPQRGYDGSY